MLVTSIHHPYSVFRGRWDEALSQVKILSRVGKLARGEWARSEVLMDPESSPPQATLRPTRRDLHSFQQATGLWPAVAIDIESVGHFISIVGFTLFDSGTTAVPESDPARETRATRSKVGPTIVVPFKQRGGLDYWSRWEDHLAATEVVYDLLADPKLQKWFHNGVTFDVPMLRGAGFEVAGELWDTMVLSHYCYPEMRKGLQYLSTVYLGARHWKSMLDETDDLEGKT